jgi:hypothetical protein
VFISVDGNAPISFNEFVACNEFDTREVSEIGRALNLHGEYRGEGGAAAEFIVTVAVPVDPDSFDDDPNERCTNAGGHEFECTGTQYGGDDESYHGEGRCYCIHCGADGDA